MEGSFSQLTGAFAKLSDTALEGYEIHMGETALKGDAKPSTNIQDSVTGERKADGAYLDNVCGTYVHGVFDKEMCIRDRCGRHGGSSEVFGRH